MVRPRTFVTALLAAITLALPAAAGAATTWVVHGAGFGHGVGLSQYGAYGFGERGVGYSAIIRHYFTGTHIERLPGPRMVRVLLAINPRDIWFTRATAACGRELNPARSYRAHRSGSAVALLSSSGSVLAACGSRLHADSGGSIQIGGVGPYRGALEAVPTKSDPGSLNVINDLNLNSYVQGSVPGEVPSTWPMATLKAQATAARSYALTSGVDGNGFTLYADTRSQVYGGMKLETPRTNKAVLSTRNDVAMYRGDIAQTFYFSTSGGQTEGGFLGGSDVPYLRSVDDPYDFYSPLHRWTFRFSQAEINAKLAPYVSGSLREIRVTQRGDSPRVDYARLIGTAGTTTIRGDTLQSALGLYDRWAFFKKVTGARGSRLRSLPRVSGIGGPGLTSGAQPPGQGGP